MRAAVPDSVILEDFMGPEELARIYSQTRLNVHPATYDAFGMTIVEAASQVLQQSSGIGTDCTPNVTLGPFHFYSQGAPSLVHDGDGAVGATDLLSAALGEVLLADLAGDVGQLADNVQRLLGDASGLLGVAARASEKARSWSEGANAGRLVGLVEVAIAALRGQ